jgi:glycerate kinase
MKILIAPDSFKNALSALRVGESLKKGLLKAMPDSEIKVVPMADGGEGTVESLIDATRGRWVKVRIHDPLMRETEAGFGITGGGDTAVIEMASASGIQLLATEERDPRVTTTFGTGELIRAALDHGCQTILLGIGGSATNDCGAGMASALGVKFLDGEGRPVGPGGGALGKVQTIDMRSLDPRIPETSVVVACDVTNPLTGPKGASRVYGPQKGADEEMVRMLDRNLVYFAELIREQLGRDVAEVPGAGAAGGLGAGLIAFLNGDLVEGVPAIAERIGLEDSVRWADLVITGEGGIDHQTQFGKTPFGVARIARKHGKPVIAVAGTVGEGADILHTMGFNAILPITDAPMTLEAAISMTSSLLQATGERLGRILILDL